MELNYNTAKQIKELAIWLDEILTCNCLIDIYKDTDVSLYIKRRQKAFKKGTKNAAEFQRHYNMSNNKMKKIIYKLMCSQFVNNEVFDSDNFDEARDGSYHPEFYDNWVDTLSGYQLHLMPTRDMIGMKF